MTCLEWTIVILCCPLFLAFHVGTRTRSKREHANKLKRISKNRPKPLPHSRLNISETCLSIAAPSQPTSKLLQLPPEIRLKIFEAALGGRTLHLVHLPKKVGFVECIRWNPFDQAYCTRSCRSSCRKIGFGGKKQKDKIRLDDLGVALLRTCKLVYNEASHIPYTANTFEIDNLNALIYLASVILPHRLRSIRYLQLNWHFHIPPGDDRAWEIDNEYYEPEDTKTWSLFWKNIRLMTGLREVDLRFTSTLVVLDPTAQWIQPIFAFQNLRRLAFNLICLQGDLDEKEDEELEALRTELWARCGNGTPYEPRYLD